MKRNVKLLYVIWAVAILAVVLITLKYRGEFTEFYGIAETREISVSSETAVEVIKIHVVPGQAVKKGDLIVDLHSPELSKDINEISHELDELRAEKISQLSEINYEIKQLQAQHAINQRLTAGLKSLGKEAEGGSRPNITDPLMIEIEGLKKSLELSVSPLQIRIDMLDRELDLLLEQKNKLYIFAQLSGIIGSVRCKEGEQVSPFDVILTLHTKSPSYVRGYIHEFVYTRVHVGMKVNVISLADPANSVLGEVVGVGSKMVEYPRRLRRMLAVEVYGREVQIKLPEENSLLLGEKVLVSEYDGGEMPEGRVAVNNFSLPESHAKKLAVTPATKGGAPELTDIRVNRSLKDIENIEASGILYLKDLKKYLVVSDTTKRNRPAVYLMTPEGIIEDEIIIRGLKKIDDMEAVTEGADGKTYIACSQSMSARGRLPEKRKMLLRLIRDRLYLRLDKKVLLHDLLRQAAEKNKDAEWAKLLASSVDDFAINIEGIFYHEGSLYLGFKSPLRDSRAVIIKIADIDRVFEENTLDGKNVALWNTFDLRNTQTAPPAGISDLYLHNKKLYILSYAKAKGLAGKKKIGNLWAYDTEAKKLSHVLPLENLKPEGITLNSHTGELLITFDHGRNEPSKIMRVRDL